VDNFLSNVRGEGVYTMSGGVIKSQKLEGKKTERKNILKRGEADLKMENFRS